MESHRGDLRHAWRYALPYWRTLSVVLALQLAGTALSLWTPYLSKSLVDRALIGRDPAALVRTLGAFAGITLATFVLNVASGLRYTRVSAQILFDMRLAVYRHLQQLSPRFYARMPLGQIASRVNGDIGEAQRVASEIVLASIGSVLYLLGSVVILLRLDAVLFGVSLLVLPAAVWALVRFRARLEGAVAEVRERSSGIGNFLVETLQGMKPAVAFNAQQREVERFRAHNGRFVDALMRMRRLTYLSGGLPGLVLAAGSALVFFVGGTRVIHGVITMGTLVAFVAYQMRLFGPVQSLMGLYTSLANVRVSIRRINEILDAPIDVVESSQAIALPECRGEVELRGVTMHHDRGATVLERVSFQAVPGEMLAIVGASGVGKSSLADLMVRQLDPDAGQLVLDGHPLESLRLSDVRRHLVVVEHDPFLFHASIAENIRYARPDATDAEVRAAATAAGLTEALARFPEGLGTGAGERGRALSTGERQRVAIARALVARPSVLVLDEATAGLDPATERDLLRALETVRPPYTTILITHRFELASRADRVVVLRDGIVAESGPVGQLLAAGGEFARLFAREAATAVSTS
ncbi:MAG: ABC transporter ATP-binding protein [Gemmatimonadaceae bacterium]